MPVACPTQDADEARVRALFRAYSETGRQDLRDQIIEQFAPLVDSICRQFLASGEPLEDLKQEGCIGLIKAVEMYDVTRGVKFTTYATHLVQGEIKHYLRDRTGVIREPGWLNELNQRISRAVEALTQRHGRFPTVAEISEEVNVAQDAVMEVMRSRSTFRVSSIEALTEADPEAASPLDAGRVRGLQAIPFELPIEDRIVLESALGRLKQIERDVVEYVFFHDLSQTEVARRLGVSCNYVSHLVRLSLSKLRRVLMRQEHREASLRVRAALQRRRAYLEAREAAGARDLLTGLYSESYLSERLDEEVARARRYGHELGLAILEIERFGRFVASRTPAAGNEALKSIATLIRTGIRKVDVTTRHGDYGFAVLLPHTGDVTVRVAQRLVRTVAKHRIGAKTPRARGLGLRGGVAIFPLDGLGPHALLASGRRALGLASLDGGPAVVRAPRDSLDGPVSQA